MFFLHELERTITLHPSFFGPRTKEYLTTRLLEDVEGTCSGQYYIICVMDALSISEGRVVPGSGVAEYTIQYRAVVWRPFKGETVGRVTRDTQSKLRIALSRSMQSSLLSIEWVSLPTLGRCLSSSLTMWVVGGPLYDVIADSCSLSLLTSNGILMPPHHSIQIMEIK